jgi:chorismate mutase
VGDNSKRAILTATSVLLERMVSANGIKVEDIASVVFTATSDLDAAYPARSARKLGWTATPLLCAQEMSVRGSLPSCIRVLILWNTDMPIDQVTHVYLGAAAALRPDLARKEEK